MTDHDGSRYDRLPATSLERPVEDRPTRAAVVSFWVDRFGVPGDTFDGHSFWEKGRDSVWAVAGAPRGPVAIETMGLRLLRTGGRHWKPTTDGVQRFGAAATRNVIELDRPAARRFVRGEDQPVEWEGDWGYLIVATAIGGAPAPVGVGLYTYGELASVVPKARRRDLE